MNPRRCNNCNGFFFSRDVNESIGPYSPPPDERNPTHCPYCNHPLPPDPKPQTNGQLQA